ncbi:MAG: hypothetical protein FD153_583 [Rhodospirillaceae bacterium]|nr:MAG: hypothetical protein FD153_583 [Rhodospirillaceae bacterium]
MTQGCPEEPETPCCGNDASRQKGESLLVAPALLLQQIAAIGHCPDRTSQRMAHINSVVVMSPNSADVFSTVDISPVVCQTPIHGCKRHPRSS